ncbi:MAG: hypothetical protein U1D55_00300 [Phycisphaerae bacterium]
MAPFKQIRGTTRIGSDTAPDGTPPAVVEVPGAPLQFMDIADGHLFGVGIIRGKVRNAGTLAPGFRPLDETCAVEQGPPVWDSAAFQGVNRIGQLDIDGDFEQTGLGTLIIEIAPLSSPAPGHDKVVITGRASLAGKLVIRCFETDPGGSSEITILSATQGLSGEFDYCTPGYKVKYDTLTNSVKLVPMRTGGVTVQRLSQGGTAAWANCGLGEPRCANNSSASNCGCAIPASCAAPGADCRCGQVFFQQNTFATDGCVATSGTMIANCLISTLGATPPLWNTISSNPDQGPDAFKNGVHVPLVCRTISNDWDWVNFPGALRVVAPFESFERVEVTASDVRPECGNLRATWDDVIAGFLWSNVPVAVRVKGDGHTVVASKARINGGVRVIDIADPGYVSNTTLDTYQTIKKLDVIRPGATSPTLYRAAAGSPCEILATDAQGRRSGFDPATGIEYQEIPGVRFSIEYPNDLQASDQPGAIRDRNTASKIFEIDAPGTALTFQVFGTAVGQTVFGVVGVGRATTPQLAAQLITLAPGTVDAVPVVIPSLCPGDANGDRIVDESDLGLLLASWYRLPDGDVNGDDLTDESDLGLVLANWLRVCP